MTTRQALAGIVGALGVAECPPRCRFNLTEHQLEHSATCPRGIAKAALSAWKQRGRLAEDTEARRAVATAIADAPRGESPQTTVTFVLNAVSRALFGGDPEEGDGR